MRETDCDLCDRIAVPDRLLVDSINDDVLAVVCPVCVDHVFGSKLREERRRFGRCLFCIRDGYIRIERPESKSDDAERRPGRTGREDAPRQICDRCYNDLVGQPAPRGPNRG